MSQTVPSKRPIDGEPPWADGATPAVAGRFFEAAAAFARTKPWVIADDGQLLELRLSALGWDRVYASILGKAGQELGLLLFRSVDDFVSFARLGQGDAADAAAGDGLDLFGVSFADTADVPGGPTLVARALSLGWKPDGGARLPYVLKLRAGHVPQPLANEDYERATACLEAVRLFFEAERKTFREPPKRAVERSHRVTTTSGAIEVGVSAPPAGLPWQWGREAPREGLRRQEMESLLETYRSARRAAGAAEEEIARAADDVKDALRFRSGRSGPVAGWTAEDVDAYLLDYYPAKGLAPDERLEQVPTHLSDFLEWLIGSGEGDTETLRAARDRVALCREAFLRYTREPQRFSPSKTLVRAARAEGVDVEDSAAVDAFLKRFRKRLARDPSLLPTAAGPLQRKAWVWTPGQPAPDPKDACPCGSGRRYRRCCMPR